MFADKQFVFTHTPILLLTPPPPQPRLSNKEQTDFTAKLVKHILGFANSGGGEIIIGFREKPDRSLEPDSAITDEIRSSYEVTRLCQYVEKYILEQDRIKVEVPKILSSKGVMYPIISVARFPEYPFVCTKDYVSKLNGEPILESGQIYIRTEGARTLYVKAPSEWRQLIKECIRARQEIEAKRPIENRKAEEVVTKIPQAPEKVTSIEEVSKATEKESEAKQQFLNWLEIENLNAVNEMKLAGFTKGFFKFVIQVPYYLDQIDNATLLEIARKSECHNTGWPIGVVMTKPEDSPVPLVDGIRAVIKIDRSSFMGDSFDYWALNNRGHLFFIRSLEEDSSKVGQERSGILWFDVAVWRISEIFCYASNLCAELNLKQNDKIRLAISYEGLKDRVLSAANRQRLIPRDKYIRENKYTKDLEIEVADIMPKLKDNVHQTTTGLFGLFDFFKLDKAVTGSIIDEFLNARK